MYKTVYRYGLSLYEETQRIALPINAEILSVQIKDGTPQLWALIDPKQEATEFRIIEIVTTGHLMFYGIGTTRKHISTFQMNDGEYVYHAFERFYKE